jgi:hypothetical protein
MATGLDANTASRLVLNPGLVYMNQRLVGPTRGLGSMVIARDMVQPEADGVNQGIIGFEYPRSQTATLEFAVLEHSPENMLMANMFKAGVGTAPNLTYTAPDNMRLLVTANYLPGPIIVYSPFTDAAVPGFMFARIDQGLVTSQLEGGSQGEALIRYTVTSRATAASPDAVTWSFGRVASIPAEVGGP